MNVHHDPGITRITARRQHSCYGMGLGIIILDEVYPGFPGDVRNAGAYPFPVQFEIVRGVDIDALVRREDKAACLAPIQRAARNLEGLGCRAIAAECGLFAYFQKEIAAAVNVPVFMSSMLQVPWAQQVVGPNRVVGLIVGERCYLTDNHLKAVGVAPGSDLVIAGAMDDYECPEFRNLWTNTVRPDPPTAVYAKAEHDFVRAGVDFFERHSNMGAMVLECTGFQPFARALQRTIDIPVFSWGTLLDFAWSVVVHRDYYGHV